MSGRQRGPSSGWSGPDVPEWLDHMPGMGGTDQPESALNPDEGVWSLAKASLANGRPDDVEELDTHLEETLQQLRRSPSKLRSCVHRSGLPLS